ILGQNRAVVAAANTSNGINSNMGRNGDVFIQALPGVDRIRLIALSTPRTGGGFTRNVATINGQIIAPGAILEIGTDVPVTTYAAAPNQLITAASLAGSAVANVMLTGATNTTNNAPANSLFDGLDIRAGQFTLAGPLLNTNLPKGITIDTDAAMIFSGGLTGN